MTTQGEPTLHGGPIRRAIRKLATVGPRTSYLAALDVLDAQGTPPHAAEFPIDAPWIAAIHYDGGGRIDYFTGVGIVVAPEWVLTCAHIFCPAYDRPETGEPPTADKKFHVRIGDPRLFIGKQHMVTRRVESNYVPPIGTRDTMKNAKKPCADVALLRLAQPTDVEPARLLVGPIKEATAVSCLGWMNGPKGSGMLTQVNTHTVPRMAGRGGMIKEDEVCAANASAPTDMTNGFSGGPAAVLPPPGLDAPPLVVGLVSRGADIGDDTIPSPAIIEDLTTHREFIETTAGVKFTEPGAAV